MKIHRKYISRCIQIAQNGLGSTAPNPMVGAIIVHKDTIIGEGYTSPYGGPHAEVNAINAVKDIVLLRQSTLYVTLEPCSHFGKTPPCANLIISHKIPRVVIGLLDPHKKVAGKGIEKLRAAGCDVHVGVLEDECRKHHKRFLRFHEKNRPYIILKWAKSKDGYIAPKKTERDIEPQPHWITSPRSRQLVHQWRNEEQAILVGTKTVLEDNPKLDVRHCKGTAPIRIILDRNLRLKGDLHIFDTSVKTIIITEITNKKHYKKGIDYALIDFSKNVATEIATLLYEHMINSVLIEGGAKTLQTFIDAGLWDEVRIFTGNTLLEKGIKAPTFSGEAHKNESVGPDILKTYFND